MTTDDVRDRPRPQRPLLFWAQIALVPLLAVGAVGYLIGDAASDVTQATLELSSGTAMALGVAMVLVVGGELWPILGPRSVDPSGVAWSTTFAFAVLLHAGIAPAVLLYAGAAFLSGALSGKALYRYVFNAGQYSLSLVAAWAVLALFDREVTLGSLWAPTTAEDLGVVLLAAAAFFVVNEGLVTGVICALTGTTVRAELSQVVPFELAAGGAQLVLAPLVTVIMQEAPALTVLAALPVAAIHRAASAWRASEHAADHDDLTGLANRKRFVQSTSEAIAEARRAGSRVALLVLDLDRFKEVNDVLGHPVGDRVLVEVGRRLASSLRPEDVVARLGGDEFAVLLPHVGSELDSTAVAAHLGSALDEPFELDGQALDLHASIGIALVPDHAVDFETLFSRADVAMYAAKGEGSGVRVYNPALDSGAALRLGLLGDLRRAVDSGGLTLEYQPKVALDEAAEPARLVGVEALVRWRRGDGTMVPPDEFVPLAEQSGLIARLTSEVLDQALAQCAAWLRLGLRVPVAVNVSLRDVMDPVFATGIAARLLRWGVPSSMLTLEITERALAADLPRLRNRLAEVRALGVHLSLDDFGTGWSSLVLLRHLPVSEVKLDREFVRQVVGSQTDAAIVRSVSELAHTLGLTVVAEGVEDAATWTALAALGCDAAQGWHVARPMPAAAVTAWLRGRAAEAEAAPRLRPHVRHLS